MDRDKIIFPPFSRRRALIAGLSIAGFSVADLPRFRLGLRRANAAGDWTAFLSKAKGQSVHFYAWGGDPRINDYIKWAGAEVKDRFSIDLSHVKLADTADAVSRIVAEKAAGIDREGSIDLLWINGENFATLKAASLLYGPFTEKLPNMRLVDAENRPSMRFDFSIPTDGLEAPWGRAQLVFFYDTARTKAPPRSMAALRDWGQQNPGRFTYPAPPDFLGTTFLKQALLETASDPTRLMKPADAAAEMQTASLWNYLDQIHPFLWRKGKTFPKTGAELRTLVADRETDIYFSFNPADASSAIAQDILPETIRPISWTSGTIGNTHFLAIPFNAKATEAAMVVIDFLLSPEAQARKENPDIWGDPTILSPILLDEASRRLFQELPRGVATPTAQELGETLPEPHPSWVAIIEEEWKRRFAS